MTPTKRKPAAKAAPSMTERDYLASLPPKVRRIHMLAKPLTGKLTKALQIK